MKRFEGRVAVVTGAAGGIGRATARALASRGCHLALSDLDLSALESLQQELRGEGREVSVHRVDAADRAAMAAFADDVVATHGHVHILVNNAGVATGALLEDISWDDFEWLMGVNFWGVVYGIRFFVPLIRREEEGHVVNLSSMFGFVGLPWQGPYCASKAAVRSLSETLRLELAGTGVGVTSVHPGVIRTEIVRNARIDDPQQQQESAQLFDRFGTDPAVVAKKIVRAIDRKRSKLVVTAEARFVDLAMRIAPTWSQRLIARSIPRPPVDPSEGEA